MSVSSSPVSLASKFKAPAQSSDAPATPPEQFEERDHEVPNDFGSNDNVHMEDVNADYQDTHTPDVPDSAGQGGQENYQAEPDFQPVPTNEDNSFPLTEETSDYQIQSETNEDDRFVDSDHAKVH